MAAAAFDCGPSCSRDWRSSAADAWSRSPHSGTFSPLCFEALPGGGTVRGILRFRCIFLALLSSAELHGALAAGCRSHSLLPCAQPTSFSVV